MANSDEESSNLKDHQDSLSNVILPSFPSNFNSTTFDFLVPGAKDAKKAKEDTPDTKLWDIEVLLTYIGKKTLREYFEKILNFLLSEDKEIVFCNVSSHLEELLVRIVKCVEILDSAWIKGTCRQICLQIIDIVKSKAANKEFILCCTYKEQSENSKSQNIGRETLVYKKLYYEDFKEACPSTCSLPSTPTISRSSSIDSIYSERSTILPSTDYFKSQYLHLILNFIKDKTQPILEFNMLTAEEAEFLTSVLNSIIADSFDKKLSVALWEVHRIFSSKYVFSVKSLSSLRNNWKTLHVEKKPKKDHLHQHDDEDQSQESEDEYECKLFETLSVNKKAKYKVLKNRLGKDYITTTLKEIVNLIKDESAASVSFVFKTREERWFLKNITNFCRSKKIKAVFSRKDRQLFDEILKCDTEKNYKLVLKEHTHSKRGRAEISFLKQPVFLDKNAPKPQSDSNSRQWSKNGNMNFKSVGPMCVDRYDAALVEAMQKNVIPENYVPNLQPGPIRKTTEPVKPKTTNIPKYSKTVQKLFEAMSVPVQSDKGMKIMKSMGWTGGGLGSKGEGITEPLMPHLTKPSGAGLGHNKAKPNIVSTQPIFPSVSNTSLMLNINQLSNNAPAPVTPSPITPSPMTTLSYTTQFPKTADQSAPETLQFQEHLLNGLYELITTEIDLKVVKFSIVGVGVKGHKKKEKKFLKNALRTFTARGKLSLTPDIQPLAEKISVVFIKNRGMNVTAWVAANFVHIYLKKTFSALTPEATINNLNLQQNISHNAIFLLGLYGPICQSQKGRDETLFRIQITLHLLKFVTSPELQYKIQIGPYTPRNRKYITSVIYGINKRTKFGNSTLENKLAMQFFKVNLQKFQVCVDYDKKFTTCTVTKEGLDVYSSWRMKHLNTNTKNSTNNSTTDLTESDDDSAKNDENDGDDIDIDDLIESDICDINNDSTKGNNKVDEDDSLFEKCGPMVDNIVVKSSQDFDNELDPDVTMDNVTDDYKQIQKVATKTSRWTEEDEVIESDKNDVIITVSDDKATKTDDVLTKISPKRGLTTENDDKEIIKTVNATATQNEEEKCKKECDEIKRENLGGIFDSNSDLLTNMESDLSHIIVEQYDTMSISDVSYTQNLDISATEEDILMTDSKSGDEAGLIGDNNMFTCDKPLELSFNYEKTQKTLNVDLKPNLDDTDTDVRIVFLTKKYLSDMPTYIQGLLSLNIVLAQELPLLKCHGVQNGALIYSCHTKKSFEWLEGICATNNIILSTKEFDKMSVKINWFFEFDDKYFFNMLEMYNKDICTKDWAILGKKVLKNSVHFEIKMDKKSFKFILDSNLELYSGVDKVSFSIIWE